MDEFRGNDAQAPPHAISVGQALGTLLRNPWREMVLRWNGKSAALSAMLRGVIFIIASNWSHHPGRSEGILAEAFFGAISAGFFGMLTQALRFADPQWLVELLLAVVFPLVFQIADYRVHAALGTQKFLIGMISSGVLTFFSSLFNLYIMRRGTLLVGEEGKPFSQDLSAMPRLVLMFVVSGVLSIWRFLLELFGRSVPPNTITSS